MLDWAEKKNGPVKKVRDLSSSSSPSEGLRAMQAAAEHEHASALDLDSGMRERLESHFGPMVSQVRFVQSDLPANFGAKALAQGDTVRVAPGAYTPGTESGEHLLSHELGHIVQQSRGQGMGGIAGMPMVDSAVESGADSIARSAMSGPGLGITSAPAAAASAPMLGLGLGARFIGFIRNIFLTDKQRKEAERLVASRAWKVDMNQATNKFNPTNDEKVERFQNMINEGITDDLSNEQKVKKLQENFARVTGNTKGFQKNLPSDTDAEGLRIRMLNMCRTFANFSGLRSNIGGLDNIENPGVDENGNPKPKAMMSVDPLMLLPFDKSTIRVNPDQSAPTENTAYVPKPAQVGDTPADKAAEQRRKDRNDYFYFSRLAPRMQNLSAGSEYAGNHELGHAASFLALKKRHRFDFSSGDEHRNASLENELIQKSVMHLMKREKKNKYDYGGRHGSKPAFSDNFDPDRLYFGTNAEPEDSNHDKLGTFAAEDAPNHFIKVTSPTYANRKREAMIAIADQPGVREYWRENGIADPTDPNQQSSESFPIYNPSLGRDTRSLGQVNREKLYEMGEMSLYGSSKPTESIAEAVAQVEAYGKGASRVSKQIYKRLWRELNPAAAYLEYRNKLNKKNSTDPQNRYFKEKQKRAANRSGS